MAGASKKLPMAKIKLMPEYRIGIPLWPRAASTDALIPAELLCRLTAWQADFEDNFVPESGWSSAEAKLRWTQTAQAVERDLREALAGLAELKVDLWPLLDDEE